MHMKRVVLKWLPGVVLAAMTTAPSLAQIPIPVPPLPNLEIRVAHAAPPALRHERIAVRPGREYVWVSGYWDWQGNDWAWVDRRWVLPEQRGGHWVKARYARVGDGWRY